MADENDMKDEQEQPSTSKSAIQRENSGDERGDRNNGDDRNHQIDIKDRDYRTYNSDESMNSDYTLENEPNEPTNNASNPEATEMRQMKLRSRKRRPRKTIGRPKKPAHRAAAKRQPKRRPPSRTPKRRVRIKVDKRVPKESSVGSLDVCSHCGHRCCRRRFEYKKCRKPDRIYRGYKPTHRKREKLYKEHISKEPINKLRSVCMQAGSACKMLSPLLIKYDSKAAEKTDAVPEHKHGDITLEMIVEALRQLEMWNECVQTITIRDFLSRNYPVNTDKEALLEELVDKLMICVTMGIVRREDKESWRLSNEFENRLLTDNHVTLFWKLYADTLKPVKKVQKLTIEESQEQMKTKDTARGRDRVKEKTFIIYDEDIL